MRVGEQTTMMSHAEVMREEEGDAERGQTDDAMTKDEDGSGGSTDDLTTDEDANDTSEEDDWSCSDDDIADDDDADLTRSDAESTGAAAAAATTHAAPTPPKTTRRHEERVTRAATRLAAACHQTRLLGARVDAVTARWRRAVAADNRRHGYSLRLQLCVVGGVCDAMREYALRAADRLDALRYGGGRQGGR